MDGENLGLQEAEPWLFEEKATRAGATGLPSAGLPDQITPPSSLAASLSPCGWRPRCRGCRL